MSKTIMLDDNTYAKLKKKAKAEDRSISKMAKILITAALDNSVATVHKTQQESALQEMMSEPVTHYVANDWEKCYGMSDEELVQMQQQIQHGKDNYHRG